MGSTNSTGKGAFSFGFDKKSKDIILSKYPDATF